MPLWGLKDNNNSKPKYLSVADKAKAVFIDADEVKSTTNKARGITAAGWYLLKEKLDNAGNTRYFTECLVAVNPVAAATAGDNDTIGTENLKVTVQPTSVEVVEGNGTTFSVDSNDASATYAWQVRAVSGSYSAVSGDNYTGGTTKTLSVVDVTGLNNYKFRCVVTSSTGTTTVTSSVATLNVNAA